MLILLGWIVNRLVDDIAKLVSSDVKIHAVRIQPSALRWIQRRERAPKKRDTTPLPGGGTLGWFWEGCKRGSRCGRPPYDRLLANRVLRADYRAHIAARASGWYREDNTRRTG